MLSLFKQYEVQKSYRTDWYPYYKKVIEQVKNDHKITDSTLEILWYSRDNGISSLRRGTPSKKEFEKAKSFLHELTLKIKANPNAQTYHDAYQSMLQAKEDGLLNKMYRALLNRVFAAVAPDKLTSTIDADSFRSVAKALNERYQLNLVLNGDWFQNNVELKKAIENFIPKDYDPLFVNMSIWYAYEDVESAQFNAAQDPQAKTKIENEIAVNNLSPLNQIFYGPPGTGKTYHTIEAAVKAAAPERYQEIKAKAVNNVIYRQLLRKEYETLAEQNRIRFVTFHQSYGYEDFVEGVRAVSNAENQVEYPIQSGIFKQICTDAKIKDRDTHLKFNSALTALKNGAEGNLISLETSRGKAFTFTYKGNATFRVYPEATKYDDLRTGYPVSIENLRSLYITGDDSHIYNCSYVRPILVYLKKKYQVSDYDEDLAQDSLQNYVLIIDEINRGNISKIFGELITLIEPSKRAGQKEAIELTLPCSGKTFSVPNNLYIIGTMNSADRSLAMMDTALRRRFDFVEMMPDASQLKDATVKGINLTALLKTMNDRIEILYDREHTLGHAFFMPVKSLVDKSQETDAFEALESVFKNKIIPLLQEYFFEDWHKIRLVLGDNQRDDSLQFISERFLSDREQLGLFGKGFELNHFGDAPKQYKLKPFNAAVWQDKNAYIGIYSLAAIKNEVMKTRANKENEIEVNVHQDETTAESA